MFAIGAAEMVAIGLLLLVPVTMLVLAFVVGRAFYKRFIAPAAA